MNRLKTIALIWRLAVRALVRDYRAGELRTLAAALVIGVAAHTAVESLTDRIQAAMSRNANELLGADQVIRSRAEIPTEWQQRADDEGLQTARTVTFPSVVLYGELTQLVQVKAVSSAYPLRGSVELADTAFTTGTPTDVTPSRGQAWMDSRAMSALGLEVGDTFALGQSQFMLSSVIALEPDRGSDFFGITPRVMINIEDLPATELITEGSRVIHVLMLAGDDATLEAFGEWVETQFDGRQWQRTLDDAQRNVSSALDRAGRFLGLAALTAVVLVGVGILMAGRRFAERHVDSVALLRCLGASQNVAVSSLALQLLFIALLAGVVGVLLGLGAQQVLVSMLGETLPDGLPPPGIGTAFSGLALSVVMLLGFALPPLIALRGVPPMVILKRDHSDNVKTPWWLSGLSLLALFATARWLVDDASLAAWTLGGVAATGVLLAIAATVLIQSLRKSSSGAGLSWRYGLANVARHRGASLLQIVGLGLGLMVIVLLAVVRTQLLEQWRASLPDGTPNTFLANIQPHQADAVADTIADLGVPRPIPRPMAIARISGINGSMPSAEDFEDPRAQRRLEGTVNVSWSDQFPAGNELLEGQWWQPGSDVAEVSLANTWAEALNLKLDDRITFRIGAEDIEVRVSSIRQVEWDSFQVNFFILLSPATERDVPRSYVTSFYLEPSQAAGLSELVRQFPNLSLFDIEAIIERVRMVMDRVNLAVEFVFLFTLAAGIIVLLAALQASHAERQHQAALLRAFGAARGRLRAMQLAEFGLIGALAGTLATSAAIAIGWVVADRLFNIAYDPQWWLVIPAAMVAAVGIGLTGLLASASIVRSSPMGTLRRQ